MRASRVHLEVQLPRRRPPGMTCKPIVGTWLSLVERTLGVGEVASSNLVVPTIYLFISDTLFCLLLDPFSRNLLICFRLSFCVDSATTDNCTSCAVTDLAKIFRITKGIVGNSFRSSASFLAARRLP